MTDTKIILLIRKTRLDELVERFNTVKQAQFYVEHMGLDFSDYLLEHRRYGEARRDAEAVLRRLGRVHTVWREFLPTFSFGPEDLIVVLGQDGLVANTMKYLDGQPVVGVNPDTARWDGKLLPFSVDDIEQVMPEIIGAGRRCEDISMAMAALNDGQVLYAVNDLFIGPRSHTSARYVLRHGAAEEPQSSSGIIVSTGLGSTGWLASVIAGAAGISGVSGGLAKALSAAGQIPWNAQFLHYSVREPFPSRATRTNLVFGRVTADQPLTVTSQMAENGVIFSDGIEADFIDFNAGTTADISVADKRGRLVV
jgi:NAD kinase